MTDPWLYVGAPDPVGEGDVILMEGTTFCIADARGDVGAQRASGLFVRDTRILSIWRLTLSGHRLDTLRVHHESPHKAIFLVSSPSGPDRDDSELVISRRRFVGDGMREDVIIRNPSRVPTNVELELEVDADFADLFEVKDGRIDKIDRPRFVPGENEIDLSVVRADSEFGVTIESDRAAATHPGGLRWTVELGGYEMWSTTLQVVPRMRGERIEPHHQFGTAPEHAEPVRRRREFHKNAPSLETADRDLLDVLACSLEDLATLRIFDPDQPDSPVIAAGAPWFMALFGRDSLLTSMMLLPIDTSLVVGTLTTLGAHQGRDVDPSTEEAPGRILHELRFGPSGTLALGGKNAYYGTADATPLFVMAVGELLRWQPSLVTDDLVAQADRALEWMLTFGGHDGTGFITYARSTERGLANQGWKDSWDGVNFADGTLAQAPVALVEVQAYAYAAYLARADVAAAAGDDRLSAEWRNRAVNLRRVFNETFWIPDKEWYAVGLDGDGAPIDALTSNIGHCLWTGIADDDKAASVVNHLLSPEMFTGWGIRTLSSDMGAYNPMRYHNGTVWPHDTAICAAGIARYGYMRQAQQVAVGLLDAAAFFNGRLPELFGGFARHDIPFPVPYPAACSPQAWAAAAPMALLSTLLRLEPDGDELRCAPELPERLTPLALRNVNYRGSQYDVEVNSEGSRIRAAG